MIVKPQSYQEVLDHYGRPMDGPEAYHAFENEFMKMWQAEVWSDKFNKEWPLSFKRIYCNKDLLPILDRTFVVLEAMELIQELKTFDGCWNVRKIRGRENDPDAWSIHSFGVAIDFNASLNPLGGPCAFSDKFLQIMAAIGWTCGASFHRKDGMHFQWADNC